MINSARCVQFLGEKNPGLQHTGHEAGIEGVIEHVGMKIISMTA